MLVKYCLAFLKHGTLWTYRLATAAVLLAGALFVVMVLGLRYYLLPNIDDYRAGIEDAVTRAVGQKVSIGAVHGSWKGYRPELDFSDLKVFDPRGEVAFQLERVDAVLAWVSLLAAEVRFDSIEVRGPRVDIRRDAEGTIRVAGLPVGRGGGGGGLGDWLLEQRQILIRDAEIVWLDELRGAPELRVGKVDFRLDNDGNLHEFGLTGTPPPALASPMAVRGEFRGTRIADLHDWSGRLYADFAQVSLSMAQMWVDAPMALSSGTGSLRLWLDIANAQIATATADVGLAGVRTRLKPELPELELSSVAGRLTWKTQGDRHEMSATALSFATMDGVALAPMNFTFVRTGTPPVAGDPADVSQVDTRRSELKVDRLDLAPIARLAAFLPFDATLRARLDEFAPSGMIDQGEFAWSGAFDRRQPYRARATFRDVSLRSSGAMPGVTHLTGELDASEQGGTATLGVTEGQLDLPRLFPEPVPLEVLSAGFGWRLQDGQAAVTVKNVSFTNDHAAGSAHGSYRTEASGPGVIDLTANLIRADARDAWRYIPLTMPITRDWLHGALLAGISRDTRLRLKGRLAEFPFEGDKGGLFEITGTYSGATLEYARGWPPITAAAGDLSFHGRRMDIRARSGAILGTALADVTASIAELGKHDEHLIVKGTSTGPTAEYLRFVAASPVGAQVDGITEKMSARGPARLSLDLDLALHRIQESKASGELVVTDNQVVVDPRLPELDKFNARLGFARDGGRASFTLKEGRTQLLGNEVTFDAANQADGGLLLRLAGNLDAARVAGLVNYAPLHLLDGQVAWTGSLAVRNRIATARFDSDLAGLSSRLPAPLAKPANTKLPLHVELRERPGRQGMLALGLGNLVSAQLALEEGTTIRRGMVNLGGTATLPDGDGLVIRGKLDQIDIDAWNTVLTGTGGDGTSVQISAVDLDIANLDFSRRRFHDLSIDATVRRSAWQGTLDGEEIAGTFSWTPDGQGKLVARLNRLVLPAPASNLAPPQPVAGDSLPTLDIVADSFRFEGKDLGRLVIQASPDANGWALRQLDATNPDGKLSVNGRWNTSAEQRTDVSVKLEVSDVGQYLGRMGSPNVVKGGKATLEGPLAWAGGPSRLDVRSLSGKLKLDATDGRFQQINPGVAKLLGLISLQSLPKRLSFDFDDIFRKGFSFDRIAANVTIASGIAQTDDFLMQGSAAKVAMRGTVDLGAETQNLTMRITPSLSESIAVAGAIVNPAVGLAALIAQKALKDPFSSIAAFEYALTGTWSEPVARRIARGSDPVDGAGRGR